MIRVTVDSASREPELAPKVTQTLAQAFHKQCNP